MKLCQNEEVLYRLGQNYLSRQSQVIRTMDNRLLCWAFLTVLSFLYGCFFGNLFFFLDMLGCGYFMAWAGRERMRKAKTDVDIELCEEKTVRNRKCILKQGVEGKEDGFLPFVGWLIVVFLGFLFIAAFFQGEGAESYDAQYGGIPIVGAASLLFIKEGAYQIGYRGQEKRVIPIVLGYRYSQLPTVCTLVACLLAALGPEEILSHLLLLAYIFDMLLFCPVFKRSILP